MKTKVLRGNSLDMANLTVEDINVKSVFTALSKINRFAGCSPRPLSVLQHSINVGTMAGCVFGRDALIWGLFHDAHEMFTGDIPTPFKQMLSEQARAEILAAQHYMDEVFYAKLVKDYGLTADLDWLRAVVSHFDEKVTEDELAFLWGEDYCHDTCPETGMHVPSADMVERDGLIIHALDLLDDNDHF